MAIRLSDVINVNSDSVTSGSGLIWDVVSTNISGSDGNGYVFDTSSGPLTLTLPINPSEGDQIGVKDLSNNFAANNLTIIGSGNRIAGSTSNFVIDLNGYGGSLIYTDSTNGWVMFADYDNTYLPIKGGTLTGGLSATSYTEDGVLLSNRYEAKDTGIQGHISSTTNPHSVTKSQVGLGNVDNTSDANKPVSTATQTALNLKTDTAVYLTHIGSVANPHSVTKSQVGLANVDNTSDANKPVSTATQTALNLKLNTSTYTSEKNAANGYAGLDANGKINASHLPSIAITDTFVIASQAAMLALTVETGDVAVRTDLNKSFILQGTDPTVLTDWQELLTPTDSVASVAGKTGVVILTKSDVGLSNVDNTSDANKPVSTATQTALNGKLSLTGGTLTGTLSGTSFVEGGTALSSKYAPLVDSTIVRTSGTQTVGGAKTFTSYTKFTTDIEVDSMSVELDGGSVAIRRPVTTGGWARGFMNLNRDGTRLAGFGFYGTSDTFGHVYIGVGESPWGSTPSVRVSTSNVTVVGTFIADGSSITSLNASNLSSGTVPVDRLSVATTSVAGAMSAADKTKLDGIPTGNQTITTGTTLVANGPVYFVDTTSAAFNLTLPVSATVGDKIVIYDIAYKFETSSPIIVRNGHNIMGLAEDMTVNMNGVRMELIYYNTTLGWRVFA